MINEKTIKDFCDKFNFPIDAKKYLLNSYVRLTSYPQQHQEFCRYIEAYSQEYTLDTTAVFSNIDRIAFDTDIRPFTLDLIYLILLTPHLKILYKQRGISEDIYDMSVIDLKWKCIECYNVYGYYGTFVAWWSIGIFKLEIFGLGRLQFNLKKFTDDIEKSGFSFKSGDLYIDTHIPSSGKLNHDDCLLSYKMASEFFKEYFIGKKIVFGCYSWLLSPNNYQMLPSHSNIFEFMKDYTVLFEVKTDRKRNLWRIFNTMELPQKIEDLPEKTSLQKSVKKWIMSGNTIDEAFGIFVYN